METNVLILGLIGCFCVAVGIVTFFDKLIAVFRPKLRPDPGLNLYTTIRQRLEANGRWKIINGYVARVDMYHQNAFIQGRSEYENAARRGHRRSVMFRDEEGIQKLLDEHAGTGKFISSTKEKVDFGVTLGWFIDPMSGEKTQTSVGIIHYSREGAFIVPARPH